MSGVAVGSSLFRWYEPSTVERTRGAAYVLQGTGDFGDECYVTPYGHSIIKGGDWMKTLSAILEAEGGFSSQQEIEVAQRIIAELVPLHGRPL